MAKVLKTTSDSSPAQECISSHQASASHNIKREAGLQIQIGNHVLIFRVSYWYWDFSSRSFWRHWTTTSGGKYHRRVRQDREDRQDRQDKQDQQQRQDRQNWHLNFTFQVTCAGRLSQFLRKKILLFFWELFLNKGGGVLYFLWNFVDHFFVVKNQLCPFYNCAIYLQCNDPGNCRQGVSSW